VLARGVALIRDGILGLAYPGDCRLCANSIESADDGIVCARCWTDPSITHLFDTPAICPKCGAPAPRSAAPQPRACGWCIDLSLSAARACGGYKGGLEASILFLKSNPHICSRLAAIIETTYRRDSLVLAADFIVPIPLHRSRERERGFNQAELIARVVAKSCRIPIERKLMTRTKQTRRHRAGMDNMDRARSVERAFAVPDPKRVTGATILLVDDIFTTGSTLSEAAKSLLEAGAKEVKALTIARASLPSSR
jgi:ComF family protein